MGGENAVTIRSFYFHHEYRCDVLLKGVSRSSSGRYCCEATNSEGSSRSSPFYLRVKFEPVCGDGAGRKVLGAAKDEPLRIECKVSNTSV